MTSELIFNIANNGILIFWALLIVAPRWRGTQILVHSMAIPVILGLTYIWLVTNFFLGAMPAGGPAPSLSLFFSLSGVMAFFTSPVAATAGWVHYLVFDLFIGAWEVRDSGRRGISHWAVIPCLIVTLLFGPAGLLLYLLVRLATGKGGFFLAETTG